MTAPERETAVSNKPSWSDLSAKPDVRGIGRVDETAEQSAICVCTPEGTITDATSSFADYFGGFGQPAGSSLYEWLSTVDGLDDVETLRDRLSTGGAVRREVSVRNSSDEPTTVDFEARPLDVDGRSLIVAVCRETTARRRAEQRHALLAELSRAIGGAERYEQGLERTLRAICTYTEWAYGEVWTPDDRAEVLTYTLGYSDDPDLERFRTESTSVTFPFGEGLPGRVYASQSSEWIPDVSAESHEVFYRTELAADIGFRAACGVPVLADERVVAVLAFFLTDRRAVDDSLVTDVSTVADGLGGLVERKQTEALVRRRNERLAEFAAVVSHDLRNPLNVATGALEMVRDETQTETETEYIETVAAAHDRMDELIEDILVVARQGKTVDAEEPIRLAQTVETCWEVVDTPAATLSVETDRAIRADRSRLRQLIENLLRNAIDHGGSETTVQVGDLETGFYLADDGPGVPVDKRETVFEPGHTTHTDGNGLGLAIVNDIATAHGWQIRVTEAASGGARFEITGVDCVE